MHQALLDAFPTEEDFRRMVRFGLGENLNSIASSSSSLTDKVFSVIEWALSRDKLDELVQSAVDVNPDNPLLKAYAEQHSTPVLLDISAATTPEEPGSRTRASADETNHSPVTTFTQWGALCNDLDSEQSTPILGPGLFEPLVGSSRQMARRWAQSYRFPLSPAAQDDLPQVAQFLATVQRANTLRSEFRKYLAMELRQRHGSLLPADASSTSLDDLLHRVAAARWDSDPTDPYQLLAALPFPLYITTNADNLLSDALRAKGKSPVVELCRWRDDVPWPPSIYESEPGYRPTVKRPMVYHLFGRLTLPVSLVLKEDDYFDFLVGVTRNIRLVPSAVRAALADSALIFLGFQLDDWGFRVLFRNILGQRIASRRSDYTHVAVQLDPPAERTMDLARARQYLQSYFQTADVSIYWGEVGRFLQDFQSNWTKYRFGEELT